MNKKLDYNLNYAKTHVKRIAFDLNREIDKDIISYLEENKPINKYLKELIRKDMKKRQTK